MKKWIWIGILGTVVLGVLLFLIASLWIGSDVRRYCKTAKKYYDGNCVFALSEMVNDSSMPFKERNNAIWALGQLGDAKGLPYVTKLYRGVVTEKESFDKNISQYELGKAIKLMQGGLNLSAIVWRHNIQ